MEFDPLLMAAVLGLVNFGKALGLTGKIATIAAMVVGVGASVAAQVVDPSVWKTILDGVLFGLAAAGFYDAGSGLANLAKAIGRR